MSNNLISNNRFSQSTTEAFKKLDKNKDGNITISELKPTDKNHDGKLSKEELNDVGITNEKDIQQISNEYKEHKTSPNKVVFSNHKLDIGKLSQEQLSKYETIKSAIEGTPKLTQLNELLRKYNDSNSVDRVLDRTLEKLIKVKNPKNIEFSKSDFEATTFGLDDANKILKKVNSQVWNIPDKHSKLNPINYHLGQDIVTAQRILSGINPFKTNIDSNKVVENIAFWASTFKNSNCLENACLSVVEASKYKGINSIEIFEMPNYAVGHAFVVINRDQDSDNKKMSTWGKNAIVIDAWSGITFKAQDYPNDIPNKKHPKFPEGEISYNFSFK